MAMEPLGVGDKVVIRNALRLAQKMHTRAANAAKDERVKKLYEDMAREVEATLGKVV